MEKGKARLLVLLLATFFLGACSNANGQVKEAITAIQEASEKTAELDNGRFTHTLMLSGEGESQEQFTEGMFVNQGETQLDWYTRLKMGPGDTPTALLTETLQREGTQYERIGRVDEQDRYLDENQNATNQPPAWRVTAEDATEAPANLEPLLQIDLEETDIESVEVSEEGDITHFHFQYSEEYLAGLKQETVADVESSLEQSKQDGLPDAVIAALEQNVERIKNIDFLSLETTWTVDEAGLLTKYVNKGSINHPAEEGKQELHTETHVELLEGNQSEIEETFQKIEL